MSCLGSLIMECNEFTRWTRSVLHLVTSSKKNPTQPMSSREESDHQLGKLILETLELCGCAMLTAFSRKSDNFMTSPSTGKYDDCKYIHIYIGIDFIFMQ